MSEQLKQALSDLEEAAVLQLTQDLLDASADPMGILSALREGMTQVGKRYEAGEYYVSDLIMAGEVFKQASALVSSKFELSAGEPLGKVVFGTVEGDIHDIGKDLVVNLLKANNYEVVDLGVDVPASKFVDAVKDSGAMIVGLSGLLTISFDSMKATVDALAAAGLRDQVKVMVGGGPVTDQVRAYVGADALGGDAQAAVSICNGWIQ
jgi:methanogenic corrinoid protein MtbC1